MRTRPLSKNPEIRIFFSWLMYGNISKPLDKLWNDTDKPLESEETCEEWVQNYREEWAKYNDTILDALQEVTGLSFYKPVIDVACAPWLRASSDPVTMGFKNYPDQFVDVLAHELSHVLLTDNTVYSIQSSEKEVLLTDRWQKLFGKHDFNALVHIPVHALSKYLYLDILKDPSRLERDIDDVKGFKPYATAWEYVNSHDYKEIIAQIKEDYAQIAKTM